MIKTGQQHPKVIFKELHNEEVQEIISRPPHWLLRWGTGMCFLAAVLLAAACWWIRYPDIVTTPLILTSKDAPRKVVARTSGKLDKILVADGQEVDVTMPLMYLESTTDPEEAEALYLRLEKLRAVLTSENWQGVAAFEINGGRKLGELQNSFQVFYQHFIQLKAYLQGGLHLKKRELLEKDYADLIAMAALLEEQRALQQEDYALATEEFKIHEKLYRDKVIPLLEFKREQAKLLGKAAPLKQLESALIQNTTAQTSKQKELLELDNMVAEQKSTFIHALLTLQSQVDTWKQQYVVTSPVAGRVSFTAPWQEQQTVSTGTELLTVSPLETELNGHVILPQANLGKLRNGQQVLVKLDGYPFREFGIVDGKLSGLSLTPGRDSTYWGIVTLPTGLKTRYGHTLTYKNGMKGTAEIITEERRLLERLFSALSTGGANR